MRLISVQKRNGLDRKGFTLIELLVVITIIGILMALTLGVISKVFAYLDETKVVAEVNRLAQGCEQFKATFGRYPPSKIILAETGAVYSAIISSTSAPTGYTLLQWQQLGAFSVEYLTSIMPGIDFNRSYPPAAPVWFGHDWAGEFPNLGQPYSGYINPSASRPSGASAGPKFYVLEGQQCLTYFLGGLRYGYSPANQTPGFTGFNTDKTNPTAQTNGARLASFFDFDASRLTTSQLPAYKDVYGTPYAYFASKYQGMNNYPNYYFPVVNSTQNDCPTLTNNGTVAFVPYFNSSVPPGTPLPYSNWATASSFKFHKPDTYQIISAGKDKQFGTGGQYNQMDPEQSLFLPIALMAGPPFNTTITVDMLQANYDNITNVTNGRVVPK